MNILRALTLPLLLLAAGTAHATADDLRSVSGLQNHYRALLVFTPTLKDKRLAAQRGTVAQLAIEAAKRDLLFIQVDPATVIGSNDKAGALRLKFKVPASAYRTLLIDKTGDVMLAAPGPLGGATILRAIDTTPARIADVRRARAGLPVASAQ